MSKASDLRDMVNAALKTEVVKLGSDPSYVTQYIPTGLLPMDILLGGGLPRGRFTELYGDFSTLKTYIGLCAARSVQEQGGVAAIIDTEHTFDPAWATGVGVNVDELVLWPPLGDDKVHSGEEAVDVAQALILGKADLLTFDSIAAAVPQSELEKRLEGEKIQPGSQARLMSAACRRLTASNEKTAVLWINQTREKIGITFGSPETTPGGKAMGFFASQRVRVQKAGKLTRDVKTFTGDKYQSGKEQTGQKYKAETTKSKLDRPFKDIWFDWDFATGALDLVGFLIIQGVETGVIKQKGSMWEFGSLRVRGRDALKKKITTDPKLALTIEAKIREHHGLPSGTSFLGDLRPGSKTGSGRKPLSRRSAAQGSTPAQAQGTSKTMRRRLTKS